MYKKIISKIIIVLMCASYMPMSAYAAEAKKTVVSGTSHSILLQEDGTTWGWGYDSYGQLGCGEAYEYDFRHNPEKGVLDNIVQLSADSYHTMALKEDGTVWGFGQNNRGQLGNGKSGSDEIELVPIKVDGVDHIKMISAGSSFTMALREDGTVWTWGENFRGQLGDGSIADEIRTAAAINITDVKAISAGYDHAVALKEDGTVWTWGANGCGQLGNGESGYNKEQPTPIPNGLTDVKAIMAKGNLTIALKNNGELWGWGDNWNFQLGDNLHVVPSPYKIQGIDQVKTFVVGNSFVMALKENGDLYTWGDNSHGQLGHGTSGGHVKVPTPVDLPNVKTISAGYKHAVVLTNDNAVWTWGQNAACQLGNGLQGGLETKPRRMLYTKAEKIEDASYEKSDGSVVIHTLISGDDDILEYSIDKGDGYSTWQDSNTFSNLPTGYYRFKARDKNKTEHVSNETYAFIYQPDHVGIDSYVKNDSYGKRSGELSITAMGGKGTYEYMLIGDVEDRNWQVSNTFTNLPAGSYQIVVRDAVDKHNVMYWKAIEIKYISDKDNKTKVDKAMEKVKKNEDGWTIGTIELGGVKIGAYEQDIQSDFFREGKKAINIQTPVGTVTIPDNLFKEKPKGQVKVFIEKMSEEKLSDKMKDTIRDQPVIHIGLSINGKKIKNSDVTKKIKVQIPYQTDAKEKQKEIYGAFISLDGVLMPIPNSNYNQETGMLEFETDNFGYYTIIHHQVEQFKDLQGYDWASEAINQLASEGIINGTSEGGFSPEKNITRGDFVLLITRLFDLKGKRQENFKDVESGAYYYDAVAIAKQMGIITGADEGNFNPNAPITRQDMMVIIKRAIEKTENISKLTDESPKSIDDFEDKENINDYAQESANYLISKNIINGDGNKINPKGNTKRAEVAVVLYKLYNALQEANNE